MLPAGIGTVLPSQRLPRLHRAYPSTALDDAELFNCRLSYKNTVVVSSDFLSASGICFMVDKPLFKHEAARDIDKESKRN